MMHSLQRELLRKSRSCSKSVRKRGVDKNTYPAMMNHTNWVDLIMLGKSVCGTPQFGWLNERLARVHVVPHKAHGSMNAQQASVILGFGEESVCISYDATMPMATRVFK
jgi:hypothetical protein